MTRNPDRLEQLAAAIADGQQIDWQSVEAGGELSAAELESLRAMESMRRMAAGVGEEILKDRPEEETLPQGFDILEELGHGTQGRVYRAIDTALDREVALKVLKTDRFASGEARRRFIQEARILASLDHPGIVRIFSIDEDEGRLRLTLELVKGRMLEELPAETSGVEVARIGAEILNALRTIHAAGLVHGDIKPPNVMVTDNGRVVLLDFGISRRFMEERSFEEGVFGTPVVMAPEQLSGGEIGPPVDIFSVGAVLYWLLADRYPFAGSDLEMIRERMKAGPAESIKAIRPDLSDELARTIDCAVERRPEERFRDAEEMESALRRLLPEARIARRRRRITGGIVLVALLALTIAIWQGLAPGPLDLDAALFARRHGDNVPLPDGEFVQLGDALLLEAESDRDFFLYVFNEDGAGRKTCLFPVAGLDLANPLAGGLRHRLPGNIGGVAQTWAVDSEGHGTEFFLLVASADPVPEAEALVRTLDAVSTDGAPDQAVTLVAFLEELRGVGRIVPEGLLDLPEPGTSGALELGEFRRLLSDREEDAERVVTSTFSLRHPDRH